MSASDYDQAIGIIRQKGYDPIKTDQDSAAHRIRGRTIDSPENY